MLEKHLIDGEEHALEEFDANYHLRRRPTQWLKCEVMRIVDIFTAVQLRCIREAWPGSGKCMDHLQVLESSGYFNGGRSACIATTTFGGEYFSGDRVAYQIAYEQYLQDYDKWAHGPSCVPEVDRKVTKALECACYVLCRTPERHRTRLRPRNKVWMKLLFPSRSLS